MTQVDDVHGLVVSLIGQKLSFDTKCPQFSPVFDRKLRKIELENFEKVKNIKVAQESHRRNGIWHKSVACTVWPWHIFAQK
jgi:hypothetical protein